MKKWLFILLLPGLLLAIGNTYQAQGQTPARYAGDVEDKIRQVEQNLQGWARIEGEPAWTIPQRMAHYKINGMSIAVVKDYKIDWAKAYGWADSAEKIPVDTEILFQAASISKSLNAIGVLKLAQDNKLDLNTDINKYLVSWKFPYDSLSKNKVITVRELLSHTAGLTVHGFPGYETGKPLPTVIQILNGQPPANSPAVRSQFAPGLKSEYSGGGTTITQLIVMDMTKQPYDVYMWNQVLKPMGMTHSFYTQPAPADKRSMLATAYEEDGKEVKGKYHVYPEEAPAGLWTNPTDLSKYIIETQLSYDGKSSKVLDQEFTRLRLTPYIDSSAALGTFIFNKGGVSYFQHGGANEGFRCQYIGSLTGGNGVVVMVNSDNGGIMHEVINSVALAYGWKDFYQPVTKKIVQLSPQQLKAVEGKYQMESPKGKSAYIEITSNNQNGIVLKQLWDNQEISFVPESDLEFFCKDFPFPLKFSKDASGKVMQVLAFNHDLWNRVQP